MRPWIAVIAAVFLFTATLPGDVRAQATKPVPPLVDVDWVKSQIGAPGVVFLDLRGGPKRQPDRTYLSGHVPGAIWTNYGKGGWRVKDKRGTPGMLPPVDRLEKLIGGLGIGNGDHVVLLPGGGSARDMGVATRVFWTFKVLGYDRVSILDGGMRAYFADRDKKTGRPLNPFETGGTKRPPTTFEADLRRDMLVDRGAVKTFADGGGRMVDNRPDSQFLGLRKSSKAKRAGTIPDARNLPLDWLTQGGVAKFRDRAELEKIYAFAGIETEGEQINFCNTGHMASLGWFVSSQLLGNDRARLYDGSMVDWSGDAALPVQGILSGTPPKDVVSPY